MDNKNDVSSFKDGVCNYFSFKENNELETDSENSDELGYNDLNVNWWDSEVNSEIVSLLSY